MKLLCIVGTRPEVIKMAPVILALRDAPWATPVILSTGQHREILRDTLGMFDLGPDIELDVMRPGQSLGELTGRLFAGLDRILAEDTYDWVIGQGDTTSVMVASMCAFYHRVRFAHVEAGLRTFDLGNPFPEELNRCIAGQVAALHFTPTEGAADNLRREGVPEADIVVAGNTVIDALLWMSERVSRDRVPQLGNGRMVLITVHRRENFGPPLLRICEAIETLARRHPDIQFLWPVHPNPNIHATVQDRFAGTPNVTLVPPLAYDQFVAAMNAADLILTDSGGVQEEAPALGKPALVLRSQTERPEGLAAGQMMLVGNDVDRIIGEAETLLAHGAAGGRFEPRFPYGDGRAATIITETLQGRGPISATATSATAISTTDGGRPQ